jgi:3-oxoacyl-[acyl-carrier protein] reductase
MYIQNKDVLVIGGSRGIGLGIKNAFLERNCNVVSVDSSVCDISKPDEIDSFMSTLKNIDILVNNAAINHCKSIEDIDLNEWKNVLDVNLTSFFYIIKKTLPLMSRGSKIVNVSSIAGRSKSLVSGVHYTASKSGIIGLTRQLANELGPRGINVNCVCPSQTRTPMLEQSMSKEQLESLCKNIPLRRIAEIEEVVNPILFLCSDEASYIHGACIDVNGGQL